LELGDGMDVVVSKMRAKLLKKLPFEKLEKKLG